MSTKTSRGFTTYTEFDDAQGHRLICRESSGDPLDKVWIFVQVGSSGTVPPAALLTVDQALELSDALVDFVIDQRSREIPKPWWPSILKWFGRKRHVP